LIDGAELTNSFNLRRLLRRHATRVGIPDSAQAVVRIRHPVAFTAYLPTIALLHLPGPPLLPSWLAWLAPLAAAWVWLLAFGTWRLGTRHYQGGGGMNVADSELPDSIIDIENLTRHSSASTQRASLATPPRNAHRRRPNDLSDRARFGGRVYRRQRGREVHHHQDADRHPVPTAGTVRTCGLEPVRQRRELAARIGVVFGQRSQLWWICHCAKSFSILAAIHRLDPDVAHKRTYELVEQLEMAETLTPRCANSRWGIACGPRWAAALVTFPRVDHPRRADHRLDVLVQAAVTRIPARRTHRARHHAAADHPRYG